MKHFIDTDTKGEIEVEFIKIHHTNHNVSYTIEKNGGDKSIHIGGWGEIITRSNKKFSEV